VRTHRDHVGGHLVGEAHDGALELGPQFFQVCLVVRGIVLRAEKGAQAIGVRLADHDRVLSHGSAPEEWPLCS